MTAAEIERLKDLLPTSLGSAEIREQIAADILRRSVFSAKMEFARYLAEVREVAALMLVGKIERGEGERWLLRVLAALGHGELESRVRVGERKTTTLQLKTPTPTHPLTDPTSERRLKLVLDTQCQMAKSVAQLAQQTEAVVSHFPGWELCRVGERRLPRKDWLSRWNSAGNAVGWEGAVKGPIYGDVTAYGFLALKSSPIWAALGAGAGGFRDAIGNPFPPFCFGSGMDWLDADRATCERHGLSVPDAQALPRASLSPAEREIREAAEAVGFDL